MNIQEEINKDYRSWKGTYIGVIIILCLIVIALLLYYQELPKFQNKYYTQGYQAGSIAIINGIQQSGNIPYLENSTGNWSVKTIPITKLCENLKQ